MRYDHFAQWACIGEAVSSYFVANLWGNLGSPKGNLVIARDAGTYGARGAIAPLAFSSRGQGGKGALFQKYNINEI